MATEIIPVGEANPLLRIPRVDVLAWLRVKADEAGFADRELCAVQITVEQEFAGGEKYHHECPELIVMVSNIPKSR